MKYGYFRGYLCTANDDGSIPLNSQVITDLRGAQGLKGANGSPDEARFIGFVEQANAADDLLRALRKIEEEASLGLNVSITLILDIARVAIAGAPNK